MTDTEPRKGAIGILLLIVFIDMLAFGIIIPFMPFWAERYGASPTMVAFLFATYSLFAFLASFPWGVVSDKWGRKPIVCFSLLGSAVSFAWVSQADALWMLFAARALGGLMGGTLPVAQAYIADVTPKEERAGRMGLMGAAIGAGFVFGPGIGWVLTRFGHGDTDFETAFLIAGAISFLGFIAALLLLKEPTRHEPADLHRSFSGRVQAFTIAARTPMVLYPLIILTMVAFCMGGLESTFAMWTQQQLHWGVRENAIFFFYIGIIMVIVQGGAVRPLVKSIGEGRVVVAGSILMAVGFAMVLIVYSAMLAFVGGALIATGFGLCNPALHAMISRNAPSEHQGAAMGASQSVQSLCRILGPSAAGLAFGVFGRDAPYLGGAIILLIAFFLAIRASRIR